MADQLFRFLRFYQCVEFYFPKTRADEVKRAVSALVGKSTFDPTVPEHIEELIAVAADKKEYTEQHQLEAVMRKCLTDFEIRQYLKADQSRSRSFSPKKGACPFQALPFYNDGSDLLKCLAQRIYQIRCSIVHSKGYETSEKLMPDSPATAILGPDIELMQFVAQRVLISFGKPIPALDLSLPTAPAGRQTT